MSKVLHVRNLPADATESDLVTLLSSFGTIVKTLLINATHQAFVEMDSVESATKALEQCGQGRQMRGSTVHFEYSSRQEVVTTKPSSPAGAGGSETKEVMMYL
jgi:RNA recognition motif-containing protein